MSRCKKCFALYASEWQSDRCCPQPIPTRARTSAHNGTHECCQCPTIIIILLFISFVNPLLSCFIIMSYLMFLSS